MTSVAVGGVVAEVDGERRHAIEAQFPKVRCVPSPAWAVADAEVVVIAVKPADVAAALESALTALREVITSDSSAVSRQSSRLTCVFGCGGERDRGKRPRMGRIAARLADRVIVTSDNPRGEDPQRIIDDILEGVRGVQEELAISADRGSAVRYAVASARGGDVVLVAGKGHETYQLIRGVKHPFSDARAALQRSPFLWVTW